ncbi:MAG: glutamate-cysteine ligase family protein [Nanoarchaeota archaeon]
MVGLEVEMFTLDTSGNMINSADLLIKKIKEKEPNIDIKKECAHNMVELGSFPSTSIPNTVSNLLQNIETLLHYAEKEDIVICPLGTYPGKFTPKMRTDPNYKMKMEIFGKKRFEIAGRCIGFHCHYTMPWGVFDIKKLNLKQLIISKNKESLVNSYNLLIAMDPALTSFMQCSPFYQGKFIGKNSRVIVYRGSKNLRYPRGLYTNYPAFGSLQGYMYTGTDLINYISNKYVKWKNLLLSLGMNIKTISQYGSILDTTWNPIKVNAHGTLEERGMDINHPLQILSASTLISTLLKKVQEEYIDVIPSDIGINEPFKFENNKIYIPPDSHVRTKLQRFSAYQGFDSDLVYNYCKRLLKLVQLFITKEEAPFIEPFENMLKEKKTVSDQIIASAKKKGYSIKDELPQAVAAEIALNHSKRLFKEIVLTRKLIENVPIL